jgi:hypothetical protein
MTEGRRGIVLGVVLIGLGLLFLLDRLVGVDLAEAGWPLFVIVPGILLFGWSVSQAGREGVGLAVAGGITTVVGLILAVQNATGLWSTWAYAWALVGPGGTGLGMAGYGLLRRETSLVTAGLRSIAAGIGLFLAFGLFFEGIIGLSGRPFLTTEVGPYILIVAGLAVVTLGLVRSRRRAS